MPVDPAPFIAIWTPLPETVMPLGRLRAHASEKTTGR